MRPGPHGEQHHGRGGQFREGSGGLKGEKETRPLGAAPTEGQPGPGERPTPRLGTVGVVRCAYFPQDPRVYKEVRALRAAGFSVHVFALRMPGEAPHEVLGGDLAGVTVTRMGRAQTRGSLGARMAMYTGFLCWAARGLFRLQLREPLDIVQVNTLPDFLVFAALPVRALGARVVLDLHELVPELFGAEYQGRFRPVLLAGLTFVEKAAMAFADRVICPGPSYREVYAARRAPLHKFTEIYNVPDESIFRPLGLARDPNLIVAHGSVIERYGFDLIVAAMPRILRSRPDAVLEIIGDGEHLSTVRALAARSGVGDHVRFTGRVPLETMSERLERAAVGVVATIVNPFTDRILPNKVYELVALGIPVVASETRGLLAQFGREGIAYFPSGDVERLADEVVRLLGDAEAAATTAKCARQVYEEIRWDRNRRDYQRVFLELVGAELDEG